MIGEKVTKPWGNYEVLWVYGNLCVTKRIELNPGQRFSLQSHNNRDEWWKILSGEGVVTLGDLEIEVSSGQEFYIPRKTIHRAGAYSKGLVFFETQTGNVDENDIVRLEDDYGRVEKK